MKTTNPFQGLTAALVIAFGAWLGCSAENPSGPEPQPQQVSKKVQDAGSATARIYQNVTSFEELSALISGPNAVAKLDIPEMSNPQRAAAHARRVEKRVVGRLLSTKPGLERQMADGDSVLWEGEFEENGVTYRGKLLYNADTDEARLYVVGFRFPDTHPLSYDSTEIKARLNRTLSDDSDDVLLAVDLLKRYKEGGLIVEEQGRFVPDPYNPGSEITGGVLSNEVRYASSSFVRKTAARLEYHEGQGGSYSKESEFADGSTSREEATFNVDGTGTFSELRRDGTSVEGQFDSAEDDGEGSFTLTTTFPSGSDPVSMTESGTFQVNAADSTLNGSFEREVIYKDGRKETERVAVEQMRAGDVLTTTLDVENSDGSGGNITLVETPEVAQASGQWVDTDQTLMDFVAQYYATDNSAHLEFEKYASQADYDAGADPILTGVFDFYPDGSGKGTITEGDQTYDVVIHPDGSVTITPRS